MATKAQVIKCIETIAPYAIAEYNKGKKILPSVCIAQACHESGYLTSPKMKRANAVFGIKVGKNKVHFGKAWKDNAYSTKTKECYDGKTYVQITDMFRAYDTIQESVEDYYDMLCSCSRYKAAVGAKTPLETITAIKNGGYATGLDYVKHVMSIIKSNDLTKYDNAKSISVPGVSNETFKIGTNYILNVDLFVRDSAGGHKKHFDELTANAKLHAEKQGDGTAVLKKDTKVTCKDVAKLSNGSIWIRIPSGWICGVNATGKVYIS